MKKVKKEEVKEEELVKEAEEIIESNELTIKQKCIACLLVGMIIGALAMMLCWPKRIAKLSNGEEIVVSIGEINFTANDVYDSVKGESALISLLDMIDYAILLEQYGEIEEADEYAKEQAEYIYESYELYYGYSKEDYLIQSGYKDEDEFLTLLNHDYYYNLYFEDYLLDLVDDKELQTYYNSKVSGAKVVHVFTKYDDSVDLKDIKKALDKGKSLDYVNSKYSGAVYTELGELTFADYASYSDTFIDYLYPLKAGKTSDVFEDEDGGEVLIYVESVEDKLPLDEIKDELKSMLADKKGNEDTTLYYKAFIELREENGMRFSDTEFEELYNSYVKNFE